MGWTKSSHIVVVAAYIHLLFCSEFGSTAHPGSSASRLHLCVSCSMLHWKYTQERKKDVLLIMLSSWIYLSTILWRPVLVLQLCVLWGSLVYLANLYINYMYREQDYCSVFNDAQSIIGDCWDVHAQRPATYEKSL